MIRPGRPGLQGEDSLLAGERSMSTELAQPRPMTATPNHPEEDSHDDTLP